MKLNSLLKTITLLIVLGLVSSCAQVKLPDGSVKMKSDSMMMDYFNDFELATESHDWEKVMMIIHPEYVSEQHDGFLEGRTDQFLNEFFNTPKDQIKELDFIVLYLWRDIRWVVFKVTKSNGEKIQATWSIKDRNDDSGYKIGLVGAVG